MKYKIEQTTHEYNGKQMQDLVLTFKNGKRWKLIPLTKDNGSKKSRALFYALLNDTAR